MRIAVHGLGYVGLTAAVHWARAGWTVVGYDPDPKTIQGLRDGKPRAGEFLDYLDHDVADLVHRQLIVPAEQFEATLDCEVHSIAVPTERDGEPHTAIVTAALRELAGRAATGATILVESTLTPGTMDGFLVAVGGVEALTARRLAVAVCPRRDWFADPAQNLETMPRVVGGVTPACTIRARELLRVVSREVLTPEDEPHYRTAELTKAIENSLLHTQVMLVSELAMNRPDLNVAEAVQLATTHPRLRPLYLGAGSGGRCVPLGTKYLLAASGPGGLFEQALRTDRHMRIAAAAAIAAEKPQRVLVAGIAYRPDFRDAGESPGLAVAQHLRRDFGLDVTVADPMWPLGELENLSGFPVAPLSTNYDVVALITPHSAYRSWPASAAAELKGRAIFDAQGTWRGFRRLFAAHSIRYKQLGTPGWRCGT